MAQPDEKISAFLAERIAANDFPSAVYLVAAAGRVVVEDAIGDAVRIPEQIKATVETIYDLASLTKPLVTGLICAQLVEEGKLQLDEPIAHTLAEFDRPDKRRISVRQLLTHTSGLPAWRPLSIITGRDRTRALTAIAAEVLESEPGTRVCYSDLGFITLGFLLERIESASLAEIAMRRVFAPLNLQHTFFNPDPAWRAQIAASETGNAYEREKSSELGEATEWREEVIWGEVHDGNAHFLGGVAGHAGLFSTARETFRLAEQFIAGRTELLAKETCELFRTNLTQGLEEARSFGWQLAETTNSTAGPALPADSFGHLGFTGTSCWIYAARERVFILLTNRTHARQLPFVLINDVRRTFHTLASATLNAQ